VVAAVNSAGISRRTAMHVVAGSTASLGRRIARRHRNHGVRVLSGSRRTGVDPYSGQAPAEMFAGAQVDLEATDVNRSADATNRNTTSSCRADGTAWKEARHVGHA
jgi:hypothetical protein